VRRTTPFNNVGAQTHGWAQVVSRYRRRAIVLDGLSGFLVGIAIAVSTRSSGLQVAVIAVGGAAAILALVALARGYDVSELGDGPAEYQALLRAGGWAAVLLMVLSYLTKAEFSRLRVLGGVAVLVLLALIGRYLLRRLLHHRRKRGEAMMRTVVVGERSVAAGLVLDLGGAPHHGYQVVGVCAPGLEGSRGVTDAPVVGAVADVVQVVVDRAIDVVVVAGSTLSGEALRRLSWALDRASAKLIVVPDLVEVTGPRLTLHSAAGLSLLEVEVAAPRRRMIAKAVMDRVVGTLLLVLAAPVIAIAAAAVRLTSRGPAFHRQTRVGVDGSFFTMWKIRSMYPDAGARQNELAGLDEGAGVLFKVRDDPRVTPVGRFLRRFSLDELPQLLNVVRGDMSLVGPRPPLAGEVAKYEDAVQRRLRVKPGLTGLWQVSGRSDLSWEESVRLDLRYVDNWSVVMDMMILWKTARAVFMGEGAY
jgi:exopolysaccharide biosynthesis polyprenyl glycosylphosphotransferase